MVRFQRASADLHLVQAERVHMEASMKWRHSSAEPDLANYKDWNSVSRLQIWINTQLWANYEHEERRAVELATTLLPRWKVQLLFASNPLAGLISSLFRPRSLFTLVLVSSMSMVTSCFRPFQKVLKPTLEYSLICIAWPEGVLEHLEIWNLMDVPFYRCTRAASASITPPED